MTNSVFFLTSTFFDLKAFRIAFNQLWASGEMTYKNQITAYSTLPQIISYQNSSLIAHIESAKSHVVSYANTCAVSTYY